MKRKRKENPVVGDVADILVKRVRFDQVVSYTSITQIYTTS